MAAAVLCLSLVGCAGVEGTPTAATSTLSGPDPARCEEVPQAEVAQIDSSFLDGQRLIGARGVQDGAFFYIAGTVLTRDGTMDAPGAVWVVHQGSVYSISDAAASRSYMPDGRGILAANPYSEAGLLVQDCVTVGR
ncbi:hypothetical protein L618_009700000020 [Rhodococcus rhodochrous J45]|uniref:Uncharacterized protein n=1 Tax=Rhodococcus rhodochrous J45 TaxID=935266 RepID=A0A562D5R3_RHORH|nr:hypothetical protein L618_009700000020 [Rhodococcus rhodochrous J45]